MKQPSQEEKLAQYVARINTFALAFVFAFLGGLTLFIMTAILVIKGGEQVGPHLVLLREYFPGYSVTWPGSFVGLFYGIVAGGIFGAAIGYLYNRIVSIVSSRTPV